MESTRIDDVIDRCLECGLNKSKFRQDDDFSVMIWRRVVDDAGQVKEPVRRLDLTIAGQRLTRKRLMELLSLRGRDNFRVTYLEPSIAEGYVSKLYPESDNRPGQAYYLTEKGLALLSVLKERNPDSV